MMLEGTGDTVVLNRTCTAILQVIGGDDVAVFAFFGSFLMFWPILGRFLRSNVGLEAADGSGIMQEGTGDSAASKRTLVGVPALTGGDDTAFFVFLGEIPEFQCVFGGWDNAGGSAGLGDGAR